MPSLTQKFSERGLFKLPSWLHANAVHYETYAGSRSYGVENENSDYDVVGFAIPPLEIVFPHMAGKVYGYSDFPEVKPFIAQHITDNGKEYDFTIYSIVQFFALLKKCNPNMVANIFTPQNCVIHITRVGQMVRENRKLFIHKGVFHRMKAYAFSQLHKMDSKTPEEGSKRAKLREEHGFDSKFAYNLVRLCGECEQLLLTGEVDLQRDKEHLKAIRRGDVSEEEIRKWAAEKEPYLERLYQNSKLPEEADEEKIRALLIDCLQDHYGSLDKCIVNPDAAVVALKQIRDIIDKNKSLLG